MSKQMFTQIDHVHVISTDIDASVEFYTKVLGFYLSRRIEMNGRDTAYVGLGNVMLELHAPPRGSQEIPAGAVRPLGLTVANMDEAVEHLKQHGVEVMEIRDGWTFNGRHATIKDPSGIVLELREWYAPDGPSYLDWQPRRDDIVRTA